MEKKDLLTHWRRGFQRCSENLSQVIANAFDEHRNTGDFPSVRIDAQKLKAAFKQMIQRPFDPAYFDRFRGPAKGVFHAYDIATRKEVDVSVLHSVWDKSIRTDGKYIQKITGSETGYYQPDRLPDLSEKRVDVIVNLYEDNLGVTGWVSKYQRGREELTSVAYLIGEREMLWMNKAISTNEQPVEDNVFLVSLEWDGIFNGKERYFIVGLSFDINFDECTAAVFGDRIGKGHYDPI